ncbi:MAG: AcrR family transcriptional regulator [Lentimonas sp.]|jgi:AcrR family transcriptional regulator
MTLRPTPTTTANTRSRIIRAAEKLFSEKGFQAMTMREVTELAQVNLAAINYHFGSKSALIHEVIGTHVNPINQERRRQLKTLQLHYQAQPIPVELIFDSLMRPLFKHAAKGKFPQLVGRAMAEPSKFMQAMHKEFFAELSAQYMQELQRSCPHLNGETVTYRFFLAVSTMIGTIIDQVRWETLFGSKLDRTKLDRVVEELVQFIAAGFKQ